MATPLTQFQQKRVQRRRTSDIENLFKQYQQQINSITGEYESSYKAYQGKVAETMAPYESAVSQYQTNFSKYETDLASYRGSLAAYQDQLAKALESPTTEVPTTDYSTKNLRGVTSISIGGTRYTANDLPEGYTYEGGKLYKVTDPGKFEGISPTAPEVPTAPTLPEFDTSPFEEKKKLAEESFKREVGERKAGKLTAVSKRSARSLLSGATS